MRVLVSVLLLAGCGVPAGQFDAQRGQDSGTTTGPGPRLLKAKILNRYAESIFTLRLAPTSDAGASGGAALFQDTRVPANESREVAFAGNTGDVLDLEARVVSLGSPTTFTGTTRPVPADKGTLVFVYDYDLALAKFRLLFGWEL